MNEDSNKDRDLIFARIQNVQNIVDYHRDQVDLTFTFFVRNTGLIVAALLGLLTQRASFEGFVDKIIYGAFWLVLLVGFYSIYKIWAHNKSGRLHRGIERHLLGKISEEDTMSLGIFPRAGFPPLHKIMIFLIIVTLLSLGVWGFKYLVPVHSQGKNLEWVKHEERECFKLLAQGLVISDRWRIIEKADENDNYKWEWEITTKNPLEWEFGKKGKRGNGMPILIEYILYDESGFEIASDEIKSLMISGGNQKFRNMSKLKRLLAIKAKQSCYVIIAGWVKGKESWENFKKKSREELMIK